MNFICRTLQVFLAVGPIDHDVSKFFIIIPHLLLPCACITPHGPWPLPKGQLAIAKWQLPQSSCKRLPSLISNEILGKENLSRKPYVDRGIRQRFGGTFLRIWRNWIFCFVKLWGESQRRVSGSLTLATNWAIHNFNEKKLCVFIV